MEGSLVEYPLKFFDGKHPDQLRYVKPEGKSYTRACSGAEFASVFGATGFSPTAHLFDALIKDQQLASYLKHPRSVVDLNKALHLAKSVASLVDMGRVNKAIQYFAEIDDNAEYDDMDKFLTLAKQRIEKQVEEYRKKLVDEFRKEIDERVAKKLKSKK